MPVQIRKDLWRITGDHIYAESAKKFPKLHELLLGWQSCSNYLARGERLVLRHVDDFPVRAAYYIAPHDT